MIYDQLISADIAFHCDLILSILLCVCQHFECGDPNVAHVPDDFRGVMDVSPFLFVLVLFPGGGLGAWVRQVITFAVSMYDVYTTCVVY